MSILPIAGYFSDGSRTEGEQKVAFEDQRNVIAELPGGTAETELTISSGSVTPTGWCHRIDTEADAATDFLDHIDYTNHPDGRMLLLRQENAARITTVRHAQGGNGQILLNDSANFTFNGTNSYLLVKRSGTTIVEIARFLWPQKHLDRAYGEYATNAALTGQITFDDTIPQNTEGTEILTVAITPKSTASRIRAIFQGQFSHGEATQQNIAVALFRDSVANALAATFSTIPITGNGVISLAFEDAPNTTSAVTYKIRVGAQNAITFRMNGSVSARLFGGVSHATLVLDEVLP